MSDTPQVLLAHHLKALRLPTFLREYDKLARQCAAEGVDHSRYLLRLAELEMIERERRTVERRIKEARFPTVKSLDSFDFTAIPRSTRPWCWSRPLGVHSPPRERYRGR
jgi:DNA replication protein DnaC